MLDWGYNAQVEAVDKDSHAYVRVHNTYATLQYRREEQCHRRRSL